LSERRGPWYLLTGVLIGIALGLFIAWVVNPVMYIDTAPYSLGKTDKDQLRILIAQAYLSNGDLGRARARLGLLQDDFEMKVLAEQAQRILAQNGSPADARALAQLAADLQQAQSVGSTEAVAQLPSQTPVPGKTQADFEPSPTLDPAFAIQTPTSKPTRTSTPPATFTPRPTATPLPTQGAPFALDKKEKVCDSSLPGPLLQVEAYNSDGDPVSGVRVEVTWESGEDFFFTGLYPKISAGYADFNMSPGFVYSLRVGAGGELVPKLETHTCTEKGKPDYTGGWLVRFKQP
jgi:hypothetical protein